MSGEVSIGCAPPNASGPAPSRRSLMSRIRASRSASMSENSSLLNSPSSRRISASSNCSRSAESSFISASAAVTTVSRVQRMPEIIRESRRNIAILQVRLMLPSPFQFESDVDEVVRRPRPRVLERQLVELRRDLLDAPIEGLLLVALDEKGRVHDHLVADRAVHAGGHRDVAQPLQEFGHVALGALL